MSETQYTDPQNTLKLLTALIQAAGSEDAADDVFCLLHHTQGRLDPHRRYCERVRAFHDGGNNARVQQRLEWVLDIYNNEAHDEPNAAGFGDSRLQGHSASVPRNQHLRADAAERGAVKPPIPTVKVPARAGYCWATVRINAGPDWPDVANCSLRAPPDFLTCAGHASREPAAQSLKNNLP